MHDRLARPANTIDPIQDVAVNPQELRNASTRIFGLPSELLLRIFSSLAAEDYYLIQATRVCRRWRTVALDNSRLWARITISDVDPRYSGWKAEAYIQRSRGQLLDVYFNHSSEVVARNLAQMLRDHTSRLRTLVVEVSNTAVVSCFMAHLRAGPVPHLETLHLLSKGASSNDKGVVHEFRSGRQLFLAPNDLGESVAHAPALRSLRLHPIHLSWRPEIYSGLSVLELRVPMMHPPSQRRILQILRQCPGLESLHLELSSLISFTAPEGGPVSLPSLSACTLASLPPASIAELLSHMALPATTRYRIITTEQYTDFDRPDYTVLPEDCSRLAGLVNIRMMEFAVNAAKELLHIRCYHSSAGGLGDPVLQLDVSIQSEPDEVLTVFPQGFRVTELETLVVSGIGPEVSVVRMWRNIFCSAAKLRTLRLVGMDWEVIACAFQELMTLDHVGDLVCRELTDIELVDIEFEKEWLAGFLVICLKYRKACGFPLKRLDLLEARAVPNGMVGVLEELLCRT